MEITLACLIACVAFQTGFWLGLLVAITVYCCKQQTDAKTACKEPEVSNASEVQFYAPLRRLQTVLEGLEDTWSHSRMKASCEISSEVAASYWSKHIRKMRRSMQDVIQMLKHEVE